MSTPIAIFFPRKELGAGTTMFTAHLFRVLKQAGVPVTLYRIIRGKRCKMPAIFGEFEDIPVSWVDANQAREVVLSQPSILTAPEEPKNLPEENLLLDLMKLGLRLVLHDPSEFRLHPHLHDKKMIKEPICIRPTMKQFFPDAIFIPHPYVQHFEGWQGHDLSERKTGASLARLTFSKRPMIIVEANLRLPKEHQIEFHGQENRMFTNFKIRPVMPDFQNYGSKMPYRHGVAQELIRNFALMPDMTYFDKEGGGTQYTFLEAWDAGSIVVLHRDWLRYKGVMEDGRNCLAVDGSEQLYQLVRSLVGGSVPVLEMLEEISKGGLASLEANHSPRDIAAQYVWALSGETL